MIESINNMSLASELVLEFSFTKEKLYIFKANKDPRKVTRKNLAKLGFMSGRCHARQDMSCVRVSAQCQHASIRVVDQSLHSSCRFMLTA